jgi:hypothetical protein
MEGEDRIPHLALRTRGLGARDEGEEHAELAARIHFENGSDAILEICILDFIAAILRNAIEVAGGVGDQT